jgi:fused signal recognition particle receptor
LPLKEGEDPAAVAYRALDFATKNNFDVLLIDTAGRLQNKQNLMDELKKINAVLQKIDASAPHENLLILDATIGQNAKNQLEIFNQIVGITGLVITKLDGSAKGGVVVAISKIFAKPIFAIGIGEKIEDLQEFNAKNFAKSLVGIEL